eukprot:SAG25_NODE_561_length_6910_cov_4.942887_1_plen_54_part_10
MVYGQGRSRDIRANSHGEGGEGGGGGGEEEGGERNWTHKEGVLVVVFVRCKFLM